MNKLFAERSTVNVQRSTFNGQRSTVNGQRSDSGSSPRPGNGQFIILDVPSRAKRPMRTIVSWPAAWPNAAFALSSFAIATGTHHGGLPEGIKTQTKNTDQASAALIKDLKQRGLLDDTLVIWGGEFGRTAYSQGDIKKNDFGRDHHPRCFSLWMAGGGIKAGLVYGATDDFGYNIVTLRVASPPALIGL
jgi:Protein of unknown function (DUF1501)